MAKKADIEIKKSNAGKFTAWAKKNIKPDVVKMANFAKNFGCSK